MITFAGKYENDNFKYSDDVEAIKMQLVSILNTPIGTRFYAPTYGSNIRNYRFSILNYFTISMIGQEIKNAIQFMSGVTLANISYEVDNNKLLFTIDLYYLSEIVRVNLTVVDGVAS
jgi:Phage baseplate assembly protein W